MANADSTRLEQMIAGGEPCISISTFEEEYARTVVQDTAVRMKRRLWIWSAGTGMKEWLLTESPLIKDTELAAGGLTYMLDNIGLGEICLALDLAEHVKSGIARRLLRDVVACFGKRGSTLILIDSDADLPEVVRAHARSFELSYPDAAELEEIVKQTVREQHKKRPIEVGITRRGMEAIVRNLRGLTRRQAIKVITEAVAGDQRFVDEDVNAVIAGKRSMIGHDGLLEYIQTPMTLDSIGGMRNLKKWLHQRTGAFAGKAKDFGLEHPRGVLMLGVQGAGKSLCAKAIATAWRQPLLKLDPSVLYNRYIGESENNLRKALRQTQAMAPVILWIDEIEKGFASAASQSSDGGLSKRMFGTLLTWMQEHSEPVFVIATANDIEALPPELLRKGRFDEVFFVDLPAPDVRGQIFDIHIKKRGRDPINFDLKKLAAQTDGFSGAEIEQAVISAMYEAFSSGSGCELSTDHILNEIAKTRPLSVTMAEKVQALRLWAAQRCVMADDPKI